MGPERTGHAQQVGLDAVGWSHIPQPPPWSEKRTAPVSITHYPLHHASVRESLMSLLSCGSLCSRSHSPTLSQWLGLVNLPVSIHSRILTDGPAVSSLVIDSWSVSPLSLCTSRSLCLHTLSRILHSSFGSQHRRPLGNYPLLSYFSIGASEAGTLLSCFHLSQHSTCQPELSCLALAPSPHWTVSSSRAETLSDLAQVDSQRFKSSLPLKNTAYSAPPWIGIHYVAWGPGVCIFKKLLDSDDS